MTQQEASTLPEPQRLSPAASPVNAIEPVAALVVEDDDAVRKLVVRMLRTRGFVVAEASSGHAALDMLACTSISLALFDVHMPGMSGIELVRRALLASPDLAIVMLTGANDATTATAALSGGAFDYLTKPIDWAKLDVSIERALHKRRLIMEQRRVEWLVREEVQAQTAELRALSMRVAETLVKAMEAKSVYLRGHAQRTSELAAAIAEELGLDATTVEQVRLAGRLHEVGKIGIRDAILDKPGKLTPEEVEHVRDHVRIGMEILSPLVHLGPVLRFVADHHERWDGTGYMQAFRGEEISIGGRILAAVDAYDAVTTRRAYQEPMPSKQALIYLAGLAGTMLDPRVYDALRHVVQSLDGSMHVWG